MIAAGFSAPIGSPSSHTLSGSPAVRPAIFFRYVDLPAPLAPMMATV
jgi:hypothetical protein